jgi:multidrug resistance efflux pump
VTSATPDPSGTPTWSTAAHRAPTAAVPTVPAPTAALPVAPDPEPSGLGAGEAPGHVAAPPLGRHRRRPWAVITLSVALVLVTALASYLWVRTVRYEEYTAGIEKQARSIGTDLTALRQEHEGTVAELAAVNEQLSTAQDRITALADEKAQIGDDREIQRQLVDYQERISQAAANVASALSTCIDGQNQLITYLQDVAAYDPTDLERFKSDVQRVCGAATDANTQLQRELAAGTDG